MANYGTCFASFYDADFNLLGVSGGVLNATGTGTTYVEVMSARGRSYFRGVGDGEFFIPPNDVTFPLIQVGHYAVVYQFDARYGDALGSYQSEVACFIVEDIHVEVLNAVPMLKISGPEVSSELGGWLNWVPIGDTVDPVYPTLISGVHEIGDDVLTIDDTTNVDVDDSILILVGVAKVYRGNITDVDTGTGEITIDPPLYQGFNSANASCSIWGYAPTTEDIKRIMSKPVQFGDWTLTVEGGGDGTTAGTSHLPEGDSVLSLLNDAANTTGEWWRMKQRSAGNVAPLRELEWRKTSDSSGITLVMPDQATAPTRVVDPAYGIIESLKREFSDQRVSHLVAYGGGTGNERVTLADATDAAPSGYTLTTNTDEGFVVLQHDAVASAISPAQRMTVSTFSNIKPAGENDDARAEAGNMLLDTAVQFLEARAEKLRFYNVVTVLHKNIRPGQTIALNYSDNHLTLNPSTLYIVEYEHFIGPDNVRRTRLLLGEQLTPRVTGATTIASQLTGTAQQVFGLAASSPSSSGGGSGATHSPVFIKSTSEPTGALAIDSNQGLTLSSTSDGNVDANTVLYVDGNRELRVGKLGVGKSTIAGTAALDVTGTTQLVGNMYFVGDRTITTGYGDLTIGSQTVLRVSQNTQWQGPLTLSNTSGDLTINPAVDLNIDADVEFQGARSIKTSSGDLTLAPADDALVASGKDLTASNWASGFLGTAWGIQSTGHGDFRSLYADELRVTRFQAEVGIVKTGSLWVTPGASSLAADFVVPAVSSTGTLTVEDAEGLPNVPVFADNDYVLLRLFDHTSGALNVYNVWGQVTGYTDVGSSTTQTYTFTTRAVDASAVGATVPTGTPALGLGQDGSGYWRADTLDAAGAPYSAITTWRDNPYTDTNRTEHARLGRLTGLAGVNSAWGLFAGASPTGRRIVAGDGGVEIYGGRLSLYQSGPDDAELRLCALELIIDYHTGATTSTTTLRPNGDGSNNGVQLSTGSTAYTLVDDDPDSPNTADYIWNADSASANIDLALTSTPVDFAWAREVLIKGYVTKSGFVDDGIVLTAQVVASDGTPLTSAGVLADEDDIWAVSVTVRSVSKDYDKTDWDGAYVRLSWQYDVKGSATEAFRIDPNVPSLALGADLPTGVDSDSVDKGGDGLWVGYDSGSYKLRIGGTGFGSGNPRLVWNGSNLEIRNGSTLDPVIKFASDGTSSFEGEVNIGTSGELRQGTGTLGSDFEGLRLFNDSGEGVIQLYYDDDPVVRLAGNDGLTLFADRDTGDDIAAVKFYKKGTSSQLAWIGVQPSFATSDEAQRMSIINFADPGSDEASDLYISNESYGGASTTGTLTLRSSTASGSTATMLFKSSSTAASIEVTSGDFVYVDDAVETILHGGVVIGGGTGYSGTGVSGAILMVDTGTYSGLPGTVPSGRAYLYYDNGNLKLKTPAGTYTIDMT